MEHIARTLSGRFVSLFLMTQSIQQFAADHRYLLDFVAQETGWRAPMALDLDDFWAPVVKAARKGRILPLDGVLVRDWDPDCRRTEPGVAFGMRLYTIESISFVQVNSQFEFNQNDRTFNFIAIDRGDYRRFYRIALRCRRNAEPPSARPVLEEAQLETLWKNTIGYLEPANLRRLKRYGGRGKRGILLTGPPGNGKTMACRWLWEACRQRRWEWKLVSPDAYRQARNSDRPVEQVRELFTVERRGIVFFDDMDQALRDRETVKETDDQAVFLDALDGLNVKDGIVFVFTTNCSLDLIDGAFKRPGRLDVVLEFKAPDARLRRKLFECWHPEIRASLPLDTVVASTDGFSFAEIEEAKNLLVMHFLESGCWDWNWALNQFDTNRNAASSRRQRKVGFASARPARVF